MSGAPPHGRSRATAVLAVAALFIAFTGLAVVVDRTSGGGSATADPSPSARPSPSGPTSPAETIEDQLARIADTVESIRGLRFERVPEPQLLPPEELADRAAAFVEDYSEEDADVDRRILAALGAVDPGVDLRQLLATALSEQVAGFYDSDTEELVVAARRPGEPLGPLDEVTLAHEYEHALADQVLGLPFADRDPAPGEEDAAFAATALVEGDATLTMLLYSERALSPTEQARLLAEQSELASQLEDLTPLPYYLERSLNFPYVEGVAFVSALHDVDGFAAVDGAYRRPPRTTLEILLPAVYLGQQQVDVVDPRDVGEPGGPWQRRDTLAFGAADLLFLFEAPADDPTRAIADPFSAAVTWRGGEVTLFTDGARDAVGVALEGEPGLCAAVGAWYSAAFGPGRGGPERTTFDGADQDAVLVCQGREVRLGIAPDAATADRLVR